MFTRFATAMGLFASVIAASAIPIQYSAILSGPAEDPPNASPGTGYALVTIDTDAHTLRVQATFSGLLGTTTASHIHGPTDDPFVGKAGVMTQTPSFFGFPVGVTSGTYDQTFDLASAGTYNSAFLNNAANGGSEASAEAGLAHALADGKAYLNIHSSVFPSGEIRGFLAPVPDGGMTVTLLLSSVGMLAGARRLRRRE